MSHQWGNNGDAHISGGFSLYFNHPAYETAATPRLRFTRAGANANAASGRGEMVDAADFNWSARGEIRGVEPPKFGER